MSDAATLFLIFFRAAAFSIGGQGALPLLREDLVRTGILGEHQILEALAIGRIAPGPTGLYIVSLGYFAGGVAGAVVAVAGASIPPMAMIAVAGTIRRWLLTAWVAGLVRGVALSSGGLLVATAIRLLAPDLLILALPLWQLVLAAVAAALTIQGRAHPAILLGAGAIVGVAVAR
jgi:chromate transporter